MSESIVEQKAKLVTEYSITFFSFTNLFDESVISLFYGPEEDKTHFRGRSRKIYKDSKGRYFIHEKRKVRF